MLVKLLYITSMLFSTFFSLQGQDVNSFSLFHLAPFQTNPALLATSNQMQFLFNYRSQFINAGQAFATPMASVSMPILNKARGKRYGAVGASFLGDRAGANGILQTNGVSLAAALNVDATYTHHFSLGLQGGYFQRAINANQIQTSDMYVPGLGVVSSTTEQFDNLTRSFPIFNAGALWYHTGYDTDSAEVVKAYIGANFQSLNQPDISFVAQNYDKLSLNYIITGGVNLFQSQVFGVSPNFRWVQQRAASKLNIGALLNYNIHEEMGFLKTGNIGLGVWYSNTSSMVLGLQVDQPSYAIAFSYDLGTNSAINYLGGTAIELAIGVRLGNKKLKRPDKQLQEKEPEKEDKLPQIITKDTINTDEATYIVQVVRKGKEIVKTDTLERIPVESTDAEPSEQDLEIFKRKATFYYTSYDINRSSEILLNEIARVMRKFRIIHIQVEGHACNIGKNEEDNKALSLKRAESIKNFLVKKGINPNRISTVGFGTQMPLLPNDTEYGRIQNRRAEFKVTLKKVR
ncbi:MAG: PorP/SprF family type IX secretion system membrane protein [Microscillaceae bacterium]|nr:PorP/SprF family type IX secretion system membrane protein [Microscillaceae bacterium]MDW8459819.1 PorP/SprF family type IX secretion system membrane protein [Cytophagales bacterium]